MRFFSEKIIKTMDADFHLHYANNKGRGRDNVTITIVRSGTPRRDNTKYPDSEIIDQYRVSGWRGSVNVPTGDIRKYGGLIVGSIKWRGI